MNPLSSALSRADAYAQRALLALGDTPEGRELAAALRQARMLADQQAQGDRPHFLRGLGVPQGAVRPSGFASIAAAGSQTVPIQWPCNGTVVAMSASVVGVASNDALNAGLSALSVRVQINGSQDLFTDGQAAAYAHFAATFPAALPIFALEPARVQQGAIWSITVRNDSAATAYTPSVQFFFTRD
jgi:hypothetical protein